MSLLLVNCRITCLRVTLQDLGNIIVSLFDDFGGWTAHQAVFSVACNSDSEMLAALQTVETVIRTQKPRVDAGTFPMFSVGWNWQGFCRDLEPTWSE